MNLQNSVRGTILSGLKVVLLLAMIWALFPIIAMGSEDGERHLLNGYFSVDYRWRHDGEDTDQDSTQSLSLDYFRPWNKFGDRSEVGVVFYGFLQEDLDNLPEEGEFDPFREIADTYDNSIAGWVYLAYAELAGTGTINTVRLGRQELTELEPIAFDGGLLTVRINKRRKINLSVFGGIPTNFFEDSAKRQGDSIFGGYLDWRHGGSLSFLLGYLSLRDEIELLDETDETLHEDLVLGQIGWRIRRSVNLLLKASLLDAEWKDAAIRYSYSSYERDLRISAHYYHLFITREGESLSEDPFSILLGDYEPYYQGGFSVYKGLGKRLGVEGGAFFRELVDSGDESTYNHSWQKYFASLFVYKTPFDSSELMIGADFWTAPDEVYNKSWRGEYSQKLGKRLEFKAGTAYYLYKIDTLTGEEDEELQEYYAGLELAAGKHLSFNLDYSFEEGSLREVDTLKAGLKYEF